MPTDIGQRLADWRLERDMTQREAAELVGVTERTWARWESGQGSPGLRHVAILEKEWPGFLDGLRVSS